MRRLNQNNFIAISFLISIFLFSCNKKSVDVVKNTSIYDFDTEKVFNVICDSIKLDLDEDGFLLKYNKKDVINLFFKLEKYKEIKIVLNKQEKLNYEDTLTLNKVNFILSKQNGETGKEYIDKSLDLIRAKIIDKPNDYKLFLDYFYFKIFITKQEDLFHEIDSIQKVNFNFSKDEYDYWYKIIKDEHESPIVKKFGIQQN